MHDNDIDPYCRDLQRNLQIYVEALNEYIKLGARHRDVLDKPNGHRLVKLCVHTVPIFVHALSVSDLYLEWFTGDFRTG